MHGEVGEAERTKQLDGESETKAMSCCRPTDAVCTIKSETNHKKKDQPVLRKLEKVAQDTV